MFDSRRYNYTDSDTCRRYVLAYGPQLQADGRLGPNAEAHFLACSGSHVDKVRDTQVPAIPEDSDFVTLSVGGNDVGFFPVIDACVMRSRGGYTDTSCADQAEVARANIERDVASYSTLYQQIVDHLKVPDSKLFVLGYPLFFNTDTDQCDKATFAYVKDSSGGPFLTKSVRQTVNDLIKQMNDKIRATVMSLNTNRAQFVDISPFFEGHRFCEQGINEPYSGGIFTGIDDNAAWLYHFDWNPFHELDTDNYPPATISCPDANNNDMGSTIQCGLASSGVTSIKFGGSLLEKEDGTPSTDTDKAIAELIGPQSDAGQYGLFQRTFHPTWRGNVAIKDAILHALGLY